MLPLPAGQATPSAAAAAMCPRAAAVMFQSLAGRPPEAPRDVLEVVSAEDGRRYQLAYRHSNQTFSSYLQASGVSGALRLGCVKVL